MTGRRRERRLAPPTPPPPSRYLCVFLVTSSGLEGAAGRRGGGWGAGAKSGPGCESGSGSGDREAFACACACANLSPTLPPTASDGTPARARCWALRTRAFSFLSLPMATPPRVLASEPACRWPWGRCLPSWPNLGGLDLRQC